MMISKPSPNDVLFGRGKKFQDHPGNRRFREIIKANKCRYSKSRRYEKLAIATEIVCFIKEGKIGEHTSELQSNHDLVCRLLLEKKK